MPGRLADTAGNTVFGTFLGGPTWDTGTALAVDSTGNVYVTGTTRGSFPTTPTAAIPASTSSNVFAVKLSADGSRFVYSTYLPSDMRTASGIAVDAQGNAVVVGQTAAGHACVVKLSADGSTFLYTTVLAGTNQESATAVVTDPAGNAVVAGHTKSADFPVSAAAFQPRLAGAQNVFLAKLDPAGNVILSTYLGGTSIDDASAVQIDSAGNLFVVGRTTSLDFPTTPGSFQPAPVVPMWNTSPGGFVAKLSPDGRALAYSSYVMSADGVTSLALGASGEAYLAGVTGAGFPVTPSAPQPCFGGRTDVFVAHLDSHGVLLDATYVGGASDDTPMGLAAARDGSVLLAWGAQLGLSQIRFGDPGWNAPACLSPDMLNSATLHGMGWVAPGEFTTLTGFGIGPQNGVAFQPDARGQAPLSLAGVRVFFDGRPRWSTSSRAR